MSIIVPVYTLIAILKYLDILRHVAEWFRPAMKFFGLPGDAALALVLGNFLNLYASIGVIASLKLTGGQMTVLSLMLLLSHSQILESAVFFQIKTKYGILWAIRLLTSLLVGYGLHFLLSPHVETSGGVVSVSTRAATLAAAGIEYLQGLWSLAIKMLLILVASFILLEVVKRLNLLERSLKALNRITSFMGFSHEAGLPLLAGTIFGIVFGAGLIVDSVREQGLDRRQVLLVSVFLALCHGIVEDTGLMLVLGANPFWITVPRLLLAVPVVWLMNRLWRPPKVEDREPRGIPAGEPVR